jgi:hypothetical protein
MLTIYAERERVFESICSGACGYLLKTPPVKLLEQREGMKVARQCREIAQKVIAMFPESFPRPTPSTNLRPRNSFAKATADGYL